MKMTIAEKLMKDEASLEEVKYLLWLTLCQMQEFTNTVAVDKDEVFDADPVLDCLDIQLGMLPG